MILKTLWRPAGNRPLDRADRHGRKVTRRNVKFDETVRSREDLVTKVKASKKTEKLLRRRETEGS
jgi:hypothetical protein